MSEFGSWQQDPDLRLVNQNTKNREGGTMHYKKFKLGLILIITSYALSIQSGRDYRRHGTIEDIRKGAQ